MSVILVTQFIGVIVGTIAPLSRCFAASLIFKMSREQIWNHIYKVFETESYWIQKLSDWQKSRIPITFRRRKCKVVIENLKFTILNFLIDVQKAVVVTCKMISLIPFFFMMCVLYCLRCLKPISVRWGRASDGNTHQLDNYKDLDLQLPENLELHPKTLKSLGKSVNRLIHKAEKQQPNNLKKLLEKSSGFEGVEKYANIPCSTISLKEYPDCWSLPVVTLTAIVVSLPNFQKDQKKADNFLESVSEAFMYVTLVEESLNATSNYKWLGHKLKDSASEVSVGDILRWFRNTAEGIVTKEENAESGGSDDDSIYRSICATSMYRISKTIMLSNKADIDQVSQEDLFTQLSSMISDLVFACLTNLPEVIALKCHSSEIEKREANVYAAVQLLGETTQIIEVLQGRVLPSLKNPDDFHFIDKWCAHLRNP